MKNLRYLKAALVGGASALALAHPAAAKVFDIPDGDLATALDTYMRQSGVQIAYLDNLVRGHRSPGARGDLTETAALSQVLRGTGFTTRSIAPDIISVVPESAHPEAVRLAQAARRAPTAPVAAAPSAIETVVVTAQKKSENIQSVPIAVTALSQQQLTERQIAGGPDLLRDVPNMNFGKTNFSGYSIELRGIGTQAISVTTDPAVAVAFNGTPFIRNHFFEQEFFDLGNVEVLRGPQGTLYGRNATAGVVNIISAKPTDEYEANLSADIGNYHNRRFEGMINIPIVGDKLELRLAAEWTKRDGYTINENTGSPVDGRDLWSGRLTLGWKPTSDLQAYIVWEHFSENDDRMRTAKQLCHTAPEQFGVGNGTYPLSPPYYLSQGCDMNASLYSADAFEVPNSNALPYACALQPLSAPICGSGIPPYSDVTQSQNLRVIETSFNPKYRVKNDIVEFNVDYNVTPSLTLTSQTGYNRDSLWSNEDYNRFNTSPGFFTYSALDPSKVSPTGVFCDPQIGCADRLVAEDLSKANSWQLGQEFRLASSYAGPLNFSFGTNYLHYETKEDYYVFINSLTAALSGYDETVWIPGQSDNSFCMHAGPSYPILPSGVLPCAYIDPNPIGSVNGNGHNYFRSYNPYNLNSYAAFGEVYYDLTPDLKLTSGLRWTEDQKHFTDIPSEVLVDNWGYPSIGVVDQQWDQFTGRAVLNWSPQLSFTDQTMFYESFSHGYKAGGANPPGAILTTYGGSAYHTEITQPIHPLTFKPERVDAFELGTKNTLLDNSLTLNADVFYYNYHGYQISEIVDRTSINLNFDAHVTGAEIESVWEPLPGLHFNLAGGWEDAELARGSKAVDLIDRAAGDPNWAVVKPFPTQASNCILPTYVILYMLANEGDAISQACGEAYIAGRDPGTGLPYVPNPTISNQGPNPIPPGAYPGFDPATAPNHGGGIDKNLTHKRLPNAPPFTLSLGSQYSLPIAEDWAATLRADFYWQADSWARVFNDNPYDHLRGYTNLNLALILNSADGWQVMGYVKNVFNTTAITGTFLNSDDSGLTTNVFLTDPRLFGVRVTKDLAQDSEGSYGIPEFLHGLFGDDDKGKPVLWIELGGGLDGIDAPQEPFTAPFLAALASSGNPFPSPLAPQHTPRHGFESEAKAIFDTPNSDWILTATIRYGRANRFTNSHTETQPASATQIVSFPSYHNTVKVGPQARRFQDVTSSDHESYAILDFTAGKDVGLGSFDDGSSKLNFGVRAAQFVRHSTVSLAGDPDFAFSYKYFVFPPTNPIVRVKRPQQSWHIYAAKESDKRNFQGLGPTVAWEGSNPVIGDTQSGELDVDWGLNGALLFGRQKTRVRHFTSGRYKPVNLDVAGSPVILPSYQRSRSSIRKRSIVVPNLGAFIGLSMKYSNAKVSFGYRADEFFGAMDGGIDTRKSENVGFFGPYANISIGIGG